EWAQADRLVRRALSSPRSTPWRELLELFRPNVSLGERGSQLGGQQLSDLNRVQRRAFTEVVAGQEQGQPTTVGHAGVLADTADESVVDSRCGQRGRHIDQLHTRGCRQ